MNDLIMNEETQNIIINAEVHLPQILDVCLRESE